MTNEAGLVIENVSHAYGHRTVVRDASLSVRTGEVHCLLGPSGSGKTTLLRLAAGLEPLQSGRILIGEKCVADSSGQIPPERRSIGFVFQDYALFPHLNVRDNILFGMPKLRRAERLTRVASLLDSVNLSDIPAAMPHTLSGGQQQRVALVRALAREPQVMLLDEPFSGLDARLRGEVRDVTLRVLKSAGVATLMVTHDPLEAMAIADAISVIDDGRIAQTGSPGQIYSRPVSRQVAETFGYVNRFVGRVSNGKIDTPLGQIETPGLDENQTAEVLIRPESLQIFEQSDSDATVVSVESVRTHGQNSQIELKTQCGQCILAVSARSNGYHPGSTVAISVAPREAIVLPIKER